MNKELEDLSNIRKHFEPTVAFEHYRRAASTREDLLRVDATRSHRTYLKNLKIRTNMNDIQCTGILKSNIKRKIRKFTSMCELNNALSPTLGKGRSHGN